MSAIFAVKTTIELIAVLLIVWGFIHEDKFIAFEDKLARAIAINIRNYRRRKAAEKRRLLLAQKQCAPRPVLAQKPSLPSQPVNAPAHASGYWVA